MVTAIAIAITLVVFLAVSAVIFPKTHPEHMVMSPAEEARYEIHPTLRPQTLEITSENVLDVINDSIETGIMHPALALRKSQA